MIVLDCESFDSAVDSLAGIFQTTPELLKSLLSNRQITAHFESHWRDLPDFKDYLLAVVESHFGCPLPLDKVCWFHTTRILPGTTFAEGILPLDAALPELTARLIDAVDDAGVRDQLRDALVGGDIADHHYISKTSDSLHWGPYAILVREVAFCAEKLSQHDYLGMPEIVEDICSGFQKTSGVDLLPVFSRKLRPAIVKFSAVPDYEDAYIATALCYVLSTLQNGVLDMNSVDCFDGENNPVPQRDILGIEFVDLACIEEHVRAPTKA